MEVPPPAPRGLSTGCLWVTVLSFEGCVLHPQGYVCRRWDTRVHSWKGRNLRGDRVGGYCLGYRAFNGQASRVDTGVEPIRTTGAYKDNGLCKGPEVEVSQCYAETSRREEPRVESWNRWGRACGYRSLSE